MKFEVKVKPRSSQEKVIVTESGPWIVYLRAVPEKGKANESLRKLLAERLDVKKSAVKILRGQTSAIKLVEVKKQ